MSRRLDLISIIHVAKNQLNMDNDTYRAFLRNTVSKISCTDMDLLELNQVFEALKKKGFKVKAKKPAGKTSAKKMSPVSKGRRIDKLRAIWITMAKAGHIDDGSETALLSWTQGEVKKQGGIPVDSLEWLESQNNVLNKVLEQLKRWQARVEKKAAKETSIKEDRCN
jgi:phage gp16-like protein